MCLDKSHTLFHDEEKECGTVAAHLSENIYQRDNNQGLI